MSQLGLRGKSFLKGYGRRVSVQDKEWLTCLGDQATTTYTKTCNKDDELILGFVCGPHAVFGSGRISRHVEEQEERTGMEELGGVCSNCVPMLSR